MRYELCQLARATLCCGPFLPNEVPLLVITVEIDLEVKIASNLPKYSISWGEYVLACAISMFVFSSTSALECVTVWSGTN